MDVTLEPTTPPASPSFSNLHSFLAILPNFFPPSVRALISSFKTDDTHGPSHFYTSEAYAHLQQLNIRPGTSSSSMDMEYTWPANWDIPDFTSILEPLYFMNSLHSTHPNLLPLVRSLGPHFLRSFTSALLASNQHFPSLLLATLYGLRSGHTTLCVQGIFGAGKTFSASLLLIVLSTILDVNTLLSAEPNLPLATAIENIDLLLQDASDDVRAQYGRILANHVKVSSKLDMTPLDRQASFKADSPKRCILVTQGSLLRDLCRDHPQLQSFIQSCRVAINDEAQQGGQAGFTVLAGFLSIHCLQILTGDKEQNRSGTGGEPTNEALLERLALKSVGFLNNTTALFPWEFAKDVGRALRQFQPFATSLPTVPDVHSLLASLSSTALPPSLSPSTVHQAEGETPTRGVTLSLILPQSLRCPAIPRWQPITLISIASKTTMLNTDTMRINPQKSKSPDFTMTCATTRITALATAFSIGIRTWHRTPSTSSPRPLTLSSVFWLSSPTSPHAPSVSTKKVPNFSSSPLTMIPSMTWKVNWAHLPQITRPPSLISISCASTAVISFPQTVTSSSTPTHKGTSLPQCHRESPPPISISTSQTTKISRQTSNLGLLSLLLWTLPPAIPAASPPTAQCPTQYAPLASAALHHYFSRPKCLVF